jgi:hypothetical protein
MAQGFLSGDFLLDVPLLHSFDYTGRGVADTK